MWRHIGAAAALLAIATVGAYAQDSGYQLPGMANNPAEAATAKPQSGRPASNTGGAASGGYGTLGAGDAKSGDWTGTNPGINRGQAGTYSGYGPAYSSGKALPGGNGALGAGDAKIGDWTGTNPGIDRRSPANSYSGRGYR
jgi:hypothetical protein